jgi:uncharacterized protein YjbI with pentapeptide repeats
MRKMYSNPKDEYEELKKTRTLDCSESGDLRGTYIHSKVLINTQGVDFEGAVLYGCYCSSDIQDALIVNPKLTEDDVPISASWEKISLCSSNLQGVNLQRANLKMFECEMANFQGANLQEANLESAELMGANLQGANLQGANLKYTGFTGANLQRADLKGADLKGADLQRSNLQGARYNSKTNFGLSNITQEQLDSMTLVEDD